MSQYRADIAICGALRVLGCVTTADVSRYPPYIATSDARRDSTARPPHNGTHTAPRRDVRHVATRSRHVLSPYRDSLLPPPAPRLSSRPPPTLLAPPPVIAIPRPNIATLTPRAALMAREPPPGSAPPSCPAHPEVPLPPSRRTVPARTAALVPFRRPRDRRRRLTTSSRRARAREREGGVTWAAAASRGGGRRARDAGRAHSAPFRRSQSERGGRGLARGAGPEERGGASAPTRVCGSSLGVGGALGELGWGHEWC